MQAYIWDSHLVGYILWSMSNGQNKFQVSQQMTAVGGISFFLRNGSCKISFAAYSLSGAMQLLYQKCSNRDCYPTNLVIMDLYNLYKVVEMYNY